MKRNTRTMTLSAGGQTVQLAVNPEEVAVSAGVEAEVRQLVGGEYLAPGPPKLKKTQLSTFLPGPGSVHYGGQTPQDVLARLEGWMTGKTAAQVQIPGLAAGAYYITGLTAIAREGDEDLYIDLDLVERRTLAATEVAQPQPARADDRAGQGSYTVVKGDNLWKIAKRTYGDGSRWQAVYDANRGVIGGNPNLIYPGQVLTLP